MDDIGASQGMSVVASPAKLVEADIVDQESFCAKYPCNHEHKLPKRHS